MQCGEGGASEKRVMWHDNEDFTSGSVLSGAECDLYQKSRDSILCRVTEGQLINK